VAAAAGPPGVAADGALAAAAVTAGPGLCPVLGCTVMLFDGIRSVRGLAHLSRAHVLGEWAARVVADLGSGGC